MFEVGGTYANRNGRYTVLEIDGQTMSVQYEDGITADLNINIQERIWENIAAEEEAKSTRKKKRGKKRKASKTKYFIKSFSILSPEDMVTTGQLTKVGTSEGSITKVRPGNRLLYYAIETKVFFAVVTVTGPGTKPKGSAPVDENEPYLFPVDVDVFAPSIDHALSVSTVEFESQPKIGKKLVEESDYLEISEDDFELMAEILAEMAEEEIDTKDAVIEDEEEFVA